ncbi:hypothetical protein HID58_004024 [Brassica napus]|uniref:Stress-induced protein KIN2-like n=1 Tax=Brassica napus TaxID=3708 RepID=A0ABQ7XKX4_BRANA|nr:hypothetical protein HID58_004024 [Brassica napus]
MSDKQNLSYQAGQATGQTKICKMYLMNMFKCVNAGEGKWLMDKAKDAAASAQDSMQHAGQQMKQKAQGAADVVKDKTGLNKNT